MATHPGDGLNAVCAYEACDEGAMCSHAVQGVLAMQCRGYSIVDRCGSDDHRLRCEWLAEERQGGKDSWTGTTLPSCRLEE